MYAMAGLIHATSNFRQQVIENRTLGPLPGCILH